LLRPGKSLLHLVTDMNEIKDLKTLEKSLHEFNWEQELEKFRHNLAYDNYQTDFEKAYQKPVFTEEDMPIVLAILGVSIVGGFCLVGAFFVGMALQISSLMAFVGIVFAISFKDELLSLIQRSILDPKIDWEEYDKYELTPRDVLQFLRTKVDVILSSYESRADNINSYFASKQARYDELVENAEEYKMLGVNGCLDGIYGLDEIISERKQQVGLVKRELCSLRSRFQEKTQELEEILEVQENMENRDRIFKETQEAGEELSKEIGEAESVWINFISTLNSDLSCLESFSTEKLEYCKDSVEAELRLSYSNVEKELEAPAESLV